MRNRRSLVMRCVGAFALWVTLVTGLAAAVLLVPREVMASGFVGEQGSVWVKLAYRSWQADETFAGPNDRSLSDGIELGDRIVFDPTTGGELRMQALEVQVEGVPYPGLKTGVYAPVVQQIVFENRNFETVTTGTGDVRPYVGYQLTPDGASAATTIHLRAKIPTTEIAVSSASVPLSEGQFDVGIDQTTSWRPVDRFELTLRTLFRYRAAGELPNSGEQYKPGNETVIDVSAGGEPVESLWIQAMYSGLWSTGWESRESGTAGRSDFRMVQNAGAGVYWSFGDLLGGAAEGLALDGAVVVPWTGRDYPAGPMWSAGVAWQTRVGGGR